jgi:GLPGLI family protein
MGSTSRSDQEILLEAFVDLEEGLLAETREFMTRKFLITGPRPEFSWKLTGEQSRFLDYPVYKATTVQDSSTLEAWFTPAIPIPGGPGPYGGLPGMILSLSIDDGHTVYSATEVNLRPVDEGVIRPPEEGQEVTQEEYEEIVVDKLQELEMRNQGRRRRGGILVEGSRR